MKNKNFKNLKTHEEVMQEIKKRSEKMDQLSHDLDLCENSSTRMIILDEMVEICNQVSELHSRDCKVTLKEFKRDLKSIDKLFVKAII